MRNLLVLVVLGLFLATVAIVVRTGALARKNPGQPINAAMRQALQGQQQLSSEDAALIEQKFPNAQQTESGLRYIVNAPGTGSTPPKGSLVTAHYEGRLLNGTKFDSSYDRKEPITFQVGTGQVVRGWDEAFLGMRKGEKRTLILPHWIGYGEKGIGPIPPRATLLFEVELIDFR
jgi:FKBP-type peptidyl-prolyl cis-trans isomerase